ncbi:uncharacterized protein B0T23DRAFT_443859 [Neurospora hispaniola]|uniref:Uncharacterized protein n=1 Tax=Neurospora hispaniola TaxID=588809 RepID=A0AAJ0MQE4_9PEZI|nr:hypothetical protein B0T23DRAFT_443859 [Neurospora hispaniola]
MLLRCRTQPIPGLPTHNSNTNCVGRYDEKKPIAIFPYRAHAVVVLSFDRPAASDIDKTPSPTVSCRGDRLEGKIIGLDVAVLTVGISAQPISTPFYVKKLHAVLVIVREMNVGCTGGGVGSRGRLEDPSTRSPKGQAPREAGAGPTKCARGITTKVGSTLRFHLGNLWLVTPVSEQAWRFVPSWEWSSAGSSGKYVSSGLSVVLEETKTRQIEADQVSNAISFCVPVADGGFQVAACPRQLQVSPNVDSSCPSIGTGTCCSGQRSNNWKAGPDVRKVESAQEREKKKRMEERKGTEDGKGGRGARGNLNDRSDFLWSAVGLLQVKKMAGAEHTREVEAGQAGVPGPGEDCTLHGDGKCNLETREGPCPTGSGRA